MGILAALGDLVLGLSADTGKLQSDLGRAQRLADKFGKEVGRTLGNLAGVMAGIGGAAGFGALVRGQIDAADAAGKMSQKIGVSVESLSAYMVSARLADVSNEQLQTGFQKLAKNQADFIQGTGDAKEGFDALGISVQQVKDANGDTGKIFELVAGKLAQFKDGANKTAIAMSILGKSGAELIPLINQLEETRSKAAQLGRIIDSETAAAAERFNDNMTEVGLVVQGVGLQIAKGLLPILEQLSASWVETSKNTAAMGEAAKTADTGLRLLVSTGTVIFAVFQTLGKVIGAVAASLVSIAQGEYKQAFKIMVEAGQDLGKNVGETVKSLKDTWGDFARTTEDSGDKLNAYWKSVAAGAPAMRNLAKETKDAADAAKAADKAFKEMSEAINRGHAEAIATIEADEQIARIKQAQNELQADIDEMIEKARLNPRQGDEEASFMGAGQGVEHQEKLRNLKLAIMTEEEEENIRHKERMNELSIEFTDRELELLGGRHEVERQLESEHQAKLLDIRARGTGNIIRMLEAFRKGDIQNAAGYLSALTSGLSTSSKTWFEINKAATMADVVMKGIQSVQAAWAWGWSVGGLPAAIASAAVAGAFSLAQLSAVKSTQFGSGVAPSVGSTAAPAVSPVGTVEPNMSGAGPMTQREVVVNIQSSRARFTREEVLDFFEAANEAIGEGASISRLNVEFS
jgi:hypothetical protein